MPLYEKRIYSVRVGKMAELLQRYADDIYPVLESEGFTDNLVGYFVSDTGALHQLVHLWRFDSDEDRRAFWARLATSERFASVAVNLRPLVESQQVQLLSPAPWGPQP